MPERGTEGQPSPPGSRQEGYGEQRQADCQPTFVYSTTVAGATLSCLPIRLRHTFSHRSRRISGTLGAVMYAYAGSSGLLATSSAIPCISFGSRRLIRPSRPVNSANRSLSMSSSSSDSRGRCRIRSEVEAAGLVEAVLNGGAG